MSFIFHQSADDIPFEDTQEEEVSETNPVHLRIQQRSGKKSITIVEGLAEHLDLKTISKVLRQTLNTSCSIIKSKVKIPGEKEDTEESYMTILQLGGDQRNAVRDFLLHTAMYEKNQVMIHGF